MKNSNVNIAAQLQAARQNLLDLTGHNRLLNFRPSKRRSIRVIDEMPKEVFDILVLSERTMQFKPSEKAASEFEEDASARMPWSDDDTEPAAHHTDRLLQTELPRDELQKRLYYIHQQARSVFEEQGYSVLYLALGFLEWTESASAESRHRAPLMLIPVELERQKVRTRFNLKWSGAELSPNLSLEAKLAEQGVELPPLETPEDKAAIDAYFQAVNAAITGQENWRVVPDIYLDFFSFTKFVMYKDLEPEAWDVNTHPLLGTLFGETTAPGGSGGFAPDKVDEQSSEAFYHVMDADSSQIAVIEDIKIGKSLVVEGPPGTGKSQTITNIIAELLASGKNVLFVSEKMAALEVVKSRLDRVGLGAFCLELHSHKSNKREVLQELERTFSAHPPQLNQADSLFSQVDSQKAELNAYANALHEPIGETGKSPYTLFGIRENARRHFENVGREMMPVRFNNPSESDRGDWDAAKLQLENVATLLPHVMPIAEHPWRGCAPGVITPLVEGEINTLIEACRDALDALEAACIPFVAACGLRLPDTLATLARAMQSAAVMKRAIPVARDILLNTAWDRQNADAATLITEVETVQKALATANAKFTATAFAQDVAGLLDEYKVLSASWLRVLNSRYRFINSEIRSFYKATAPRRPEVLIGELGELAHCIRLREALQEREQAGRSLFGEHWLGENSDADLLRAFAEWIVEFRGCLLDGSLREDAVDIVNAGVSSEQIEPLVTQITAAENEFVAQRNRLFQCLGTDAARLFGESEENLSFAALRARLDTWRDARSQLMAWGQFMMRREACEETIAKPLLEHLAALEPADLVACFEGNLADALLHEAFINRPPLQEFSRALHEKKIADFRAHDSASFALNQQRLVARLHQSRPRLIDGASRDSEVGILHGQFNRKRGHMPIRKLLSTVGSLIQKVKPCFMMSPLSVSQFCAPGLLHFDVIVFDEASQIRPEDALGALLRGKQAVVIGDTRQLPPTRFFDSIVDDTETEDEDGTTTLLDVESILHHCKMAFPTKALKWHYRSRHESLIAVSNQEFYDNNLLVFPSPLEDVQHLGLKFVHLPEAVYDRGRSAANREEARAVVQAAFQHFQAYPDKSLGVGTFSSKQQQAILDEVELQLRQHPEMETFFSSTRDEHFFVKNLETIQGDERDVIFLSIGYGKDGTGRLHRNFGPLNQEGGHRRLNVLITRARERCVVFSNFRAAELHIDDSAPFGVRALKTFLDYAENRNLQTAMPTGGDTDSPFEDAVYQFLRSHGHTVTTQVGCAGYRIDLAVTDPASPGRYLLGVECDGARYHSSPVARDRDRLRQQVLEGLGWTIHRIWSTDWYRHRAETGQRLLEAVERAKLKTPEPPPPEPVQEVLTEEPEEPTEERMPEPLPPPAPTSNVVDYVECTDLGIPIRGTLPEQDSSQLAIAVEQVVAVEGPVHVDEVVLRIRSLWGVKKAGARIKNAIEAGILKAQRKRKTNRRVLRKGDFLWRVEESEMHVRRRGNLNIAWICDEEIAAAMKQVLEAQGSMPPDTLVTEAGKLFGYKSTGRTLVQRMRPLLDRFIQEGTFHLDANERVTLPS